MEQHKPKARKKKPTKGRWGNLALLLLFPILTGIIILIVEYKTGVFQKNINPKGCDEEEMIYQKMKDLLLEIKLADATKEDKVGRANKMNKFIWKDYPGLLCELSTTYLEECGESGRHYGKVKKLHDLLIKSMGNKGCKQTPIAEFDASHIVNVGNILASMLDDLTTLDF